MIEFYTKTRRPLRYLTAALLFIIVFTGMTYGMHWSPNATNEFFGSLSVKVTKVWNPPARARDSVTAYLYQDGAFYGEAVLHSGNQWTHTWSGLESGHAWTVDEAYISDRYRKVITPGISDGGVIVFVITNTWDDPYTPPPTPPPTPPGTPPGTVTPPQTPSGPLPPTNIGEPGTPGGGREPEPEPGDLPKTSDGANPEPWLILLAISTFVLRQVLFFYQNRKRGDACK